MVLGGRTVMAFRAECSAIAASRPSEVLALGKEERRLAARQRRGHIMNLTTGAAPLVQESRGPSSPAKSEPVPIAGSP
jgi:hypothetical protein